MTPQVLLKSLVYLDRDFISDCYEAWQGDNPKTLITKNQGKKAGANLLPFSAEISTQETRAFSLSTFQMLEKVWAQLSKDQPIDIDKCEAYAPTTFGWVRGNLSTSLSKHYSENKDGKHDHVEFSYFQLRGEAQGRHIDLITTSEYFTSGFDALLRIQKPLLKQFSLPVAIYVRLLPARDYFENWIAVPLVIVERRDDVIASFTSGAI